jgi:chemotaxis family two-component system response regulator Rcp1
MNNQFIIFLVEDNPADVRLAQEALRDGKIQHEMHVARDGKEAISFLRRKGSFQKAPRPDLILLDLNLPRKDGLEVLREIKADPDLRSIPVNILTSSEAEEDILKSYDLHANGYIVKPVDLEKFFTVISQIKDFWMTIVTLPPNGPRERKITSTPDQ